MRQVTGILGKLRQVACGISEGILDAEFWMIAPVVVLLGVLSLVTDAWSAEESRFEVGTSAESLKFEKDLTNPTMLKLAHR